MFSFSQVLRRPGLLVGAAVLLLLAAAFLFGSRQSFDAGILNLLPSDVASVRGLKIYNSRFSSPRELTFLVESPAGAGPGIADDFVEALVRQPWVVRVLDAPPMESQRGRETFPVLAASLLLGQNDQDFDKTVEKLDPNALRSRLQSLAAKAAAGSTLAGIELVNDPTGLVAPVAASLSEKLPMAKNAELVPFDGRARIVRVIADMPGHGSAGRREVMRNARAFVNEFRRRPGAPVISIAARSSYAVEPVMIVVPGPANFRLLVELDEKLEALKQSGRIVSFLSPSILVHDRAQLKRNLARLQALDWDGMGRAVTDAARSAGLPAGTFDSATRLLTSLQSRSPLAAQLPALSPWWFVLDRMVSLSTGDVIYYIRLPAGSGSDTRRILEDAVGEVLPDGIVTGWGQVRDDLAPWASRKLLIFGGVVAGMALVIVLLSRTSPR